MNYLNYIKRAKEFKTKKRLGQNFLVDGNVIEKIIEVAQLSHDDTVIEIGPGVGFVTERLAEASKEVIAIEIDADAIAVLEKLPYDNIKIIEQDILKTYFTELIDESVKVVANIPYYITSPILVHLLGEVADFNNKNRNLIKEIILMVQYEVAKRIVADEKASNKEYGSLSVLCNYWAETEIIRKVPSGCFWPAPKVDSALVRLKVRKEPLVKPEDPKLFRKVVQAAFGTRRKTFKNSLIMKGFSKDAVDKAFKKLDFDEKRRGETLSLQEFADMADSLIQEKV